MSSPADRYADLVRRLGAERGFARGWKAQVAERLGVDASYVGRVYSGEVETVGLRIIERAIERGVATRAELIGEEVEPGDVAVVEIAADRYAALIEQMGAELGFERGWKSRVARLLGVHRSYVSKISAGDRSGIGHTVITRAVANLGIAPAFFYQVDASDDHRAHLLSASVRDDEADSHERCKSLLQKMLTEHGGEKTYGAIAAVARRTRLHRTTIWKLLNDERRASSDTLHAVERAALGEVPAHGGDAELGVMEALTGLPEDVRQRVLRWAADRWGSAC